MSYRLTLQARSSRSQPDVRSARRTTPSVPQMQTSWWSCTQLRRHRKGGEMRFEIDHGPAVQFELPTLAEIVAIGDADPELLRMGLRSAGAFTAAAGPDVQAAPLPGAIVNPISPPTISGSTFTIDLALANPTRVITPMVLSLTAK